MEQAEIPTFTSLTKGTEVPQIPGPSFMFINRSVNIGTSFAVYLHLCPLILLCRLESSQEVRGGLTLDFLGVSIGSPLHPLGSPPPSRSHKVCPRYSWFFSSWREEVTPISRRGTQTQD